MMRGMKLVLLFGIWVSTSVNAWAADPAPTAKAAAEAAVAETAKAEVPKAGAPKDKAAAEAKKVEEEAPPARYGKRNPLVPFGAFEFGPKLNLLIFPALGIEARTFNWVSASFDYLWVPSIAVSGNAIGMNAWWLGARFHPMRGSFFLGADLYNLQVAASRTETFSIQGTSVAETRKISMTADIMGITPMLGWRWVTSSGFFAGLELGAMITFASALNPTVERKSDDATKTIAGQTVNLTDKITEVETTVRNSVRSFAELPKQYPLPHIRFMIGFVF